MSASPTTLCLRHHAALLLVLLTACALAVGIAAPADASRRERKIEHALEVARHQKGDPYRYGANGPRRFDCSGLVEFSFRRAGLAVPRTSSAQFRHARRIKRRHLRPGDLMFFHTRGRIYHVGIYTGRRHRGRRVMVHSPRPGRRVQAEPTWTSSWYAATLRRG